SGFRGGYPACLQSDNELRCCDPSGCSGQARRRPPASSGGIVSGQHAQGGVTYPQPSAIGCAESVLWKAALITDLSLPLWSGALGSVCAGKCDLVAGDGHGRAAGHHVVRTATAAP